MIASTMRSFEPVSTRRTFEEAVEQIAEQIKGGDLHTGDRLPSERELAAQMRISRPTLREAIKTLTEAGVLEVRRGQSGGIFVASELVPRELLRSRQEIRFGEIAGVLEARRLLEPRVAQLAAVHATEEDFVVMTETIERQRELAASDDFLGLRGPLPPARPQVPPRARARDAQLHDRRPDAHAAAPARDRPRHGHARAARPRLDDRHPHAHARRRCARRTSR